MILRLHTQMFGFYNATALWNAIKTSLESVEEQEKKQASSGFNRCSLLMAAYETTTFSICNALCGFGMRRTTVSVLSSLRKTCAI
eukprot:SAG31_NODE_8724_length_1399_cov_1.366154_2_plen_85_part_00